jgi:ABC-type transport system substrate-binding protein
MVVELITWFIKGGGIMNHKKFAILLAFVLINSMLLFACSPAATPQATAPLAGTSLPQTGETPTAGGAAATQAPSSQFTPMKLEAPSCDYGGEFKAIEAVDQNTVKFTLCYPDPAFLFKVAFGVFVVQDKKVLDANGGDSTKLSQNYNGTGPYRLKEWVQGDHITLEANPDYWGPAPKIKTVILRWSTESAQRLLELQSGTVDGIDNPGPDDIKTIQSSSDLKYYPRQPLNVLYLGMNNTFKPFDNESVRQAFAMAIDRQRIVQQFFPEGSLAAEQFVPPFLKPGYTDGFKWYDYNPTQAKQMLTTAGFDFNQTYNLSYRDVVRPYIPNPSQVAQEIQAELAQIGVKVNLNKEESGTFLANVAAGKEALFLLGWIADYPDSTDWYDFHFTGASKNFGNAFPDIEAAIHKAGTTTDNTARQAAYDEVNKLLKQHVPMVPIAHGANGAAFKTSVQNVKVGVLNENFQDMSMDSGQLVFMQNAEPISLWPADETDGETLRATNLLYDGLYGYELGGMKPVPHLAQSYEANPDATVWTFHLRPNVKFTNGDILNANDVVATYTAQWDAKDPNHKGHTGAFEYFAGFFGKFLNAPPSK